eukprot:TRINITY_DN2202_c0_g1_i6.p1 TRINITY_DN2202_c0_g1~~TRINITY_DN2202_c0_g1_i6.p1  ORF type:complete len:405 (-),score=104.80 TRINITY_DN2202_c0_g1_i6:157-1371(-)
MQSMSMSSPGMGSPMGAPMGGMGGPMGAPMGGGGPPGIQLQQNTEYTGIVKSWLADKGFGFIAPDNGASDVFVHSKQLVDGNTLVVGASVTFECRYEANRSKYAATTCRGAVGGPPAGGGGFGGGGFGGGGGASSFMAPTGAELPQGVMLPGKVKSWLPEKGFGFLTPDQGGADVFVHGKQLQGCADLYNGMPVMFECRYDGARGKYTATNCVPSGGDGGGGGGGYGPAGGGYGGGKGAGPYGGGGSGGGEPPLPAGWAAAKDPGSGNIYYYHEVTKEVRWDRPAPDPATQAYVPPGGYQQPPQQSQPMMQQQDQFAGAMGGSPMGAMGGSPMGGSPMGGSPMGGFPMGGPMDNSPMGGAPMGGMGGPPGGALPEPWKEAQDPSSGKAYYYNSITNEVRWDRPM